MWHGMYNQKLTTGQRRQMRVRVINSAAIMASCLFCLGRGLIRCKDQADDAHLSLDQLSFAVSIGNYKELLNHK